MKTPFYLQLVKTYHAQKNRLRPRMAEIGLSPGQPKILNYLLERDGCMQRQLAEDCDIQPATVSRILDNMEQSGLICRGGDGQRRRASAVSITDEGRQVHARWRAICADVESEALAGFTGEEKTQFSALLVRMYANLAGRDMD